MRLRQLGNAQPLERGDPVPIDGHDHRLRAPALRPGTPYPLGSHHRGPQCLRYVWPAVPQNKGAAACVAAKESVLQRHRTVDGCAARAGITSGRTHNTAVELRNATQRGQAVPCLTCKVVRVSSAPTAAASSLALCRQRGQPRRSCGCHVLLRVLQQLRESLHHHLVLLCRELHEL